MFGESKYQFLLVLINWVVIVFSLRMSRVVISRNAKINYLLIAPAPDQLDNNLSWCSDKVGSNSSSSLYELTDISWCPRKLESNCS